MALSESELNNIFDNWYPRPFSRNGYQIGITKGYTEEEKLQLWDSWDDETRLQVIDRFSNGIRRLWDPLKNNKKEKELVSLLDVKRLLKLWKIFLVEEKRELWKLLKKKQQLALFDILGSDVGELWGTLEGNQRLQLWDMLDNNRRFHLLGSVEKARGTNEVWGWLDKERRLQFWTGLDNLRRLLLWEFKRLLLWYDLDETQKKELWLTLRDKERGVELWDALGEDVTGLGQFFDEYKKEKSLDERRELWNILPKDKKIGVWYSIPEDRRRELWDALYGSEKKQLELWITLNYFGRTEVWRFLEQKERLELFKDLKDVPVSVLENVKNDNNERDWQVNLWNVLSSEQKSDFFFSEKISYLDREAMWITLPRGKLKEFWLEIEDERNKKYGTLTNFERVLLYAVYCEKELDAFYLNILIPLPEINSDGQASRRNMIATSLSLVLFLLYPKEEISLFLVTAPKGIIPPLMFIGIVYFTFRYYWMFFCPALQMYSRRIRVFNAMVKECKKDKKDDKSIIHGSKEVEVDSHSKKFLFFEGFIPLCIMLFSFGCLLYTLSQSWTYFYCWTIYCCCIFFFFKKL